MNRLKSSLSIGLLALILAAPAEAHIVTMRLGDFFMGALHPLTDPVDWILWLSLALLGARSGRDAARWLVLSVPAGLAVGLLGSVISARVLGSSVTDAVPLLGIGLLLAIGIRLTTMHLIGVALAVMVLRGVANAAGLRPAADIGLYLSGLAGAGYVVTTLLAAMLLRGVADESAPAWRRIGVRVLGSWLSAAGLMLLALVLRG